MMIRGARKWMNMGMGDLWHLWEAPMVELEWHIPTNLHGNLGWPGLCRDSDRGSNSKMQRWAWRYALYTCEGSTLIKTIQQYGIESDWLTKTPLKSIEINRNQWILVADVFFWFSPAIHIWLKDGNILWLLVMHYIVSMSIPLFLIVEFAIWCFFFLSSLLCYIPTLTQCNNFCKHAYAFFEPCQSTYMHIHAHSLLWSYWNTDDYMPNKTVVNLMPFNRQKTVWSNWDNKSVKFTGRWPGSFIPHGTVALILYMLCMWKFTQHIWEPHGWQDPPIFGHMTDIG